MPQRRQSNQSGGRFTNYINRHFKYTFTVHLKLIIKWNGKKNRLLDHYIWSYYGIWLNHQFLLCSVADKVFIICIRDILVQMCLDY